MADHQTTSGENQGTQLAQAATDAAATGSAQGLKVTVAQCRADVLLDPPAAGERVVVKGEPGQSCCFDLASMEGSTVTLEGNTLMITLAGGGEIVLENFIPSAPGILPAAMCLADGTVIETADLILQSGSTMADVTPAFGDIAPGAGGLPGAARYCTVPTCDAPVVPTRPSDHGCCAVIPGANMTYACPSTELRTNGLDVCLPYLARSGRTGWVFAFHTWRAHIEPAPFVVSPSNHRLSQVCFSQEAWLTRRPSTISGRTQIGGNVTSKLEPL